MPTPNEGESRDDFVSRCIPIVLEDGTAESQDQAVAVCNSMWEEDQAKVNWTRAEVLGGGNMEKQMERKTFCGFVTKADEEQGIVEAYFAVFGNIDQGNDIIHPGAFTKTFLERGGKVRVLDNHRTDTIERAIGKPLLLKEVSRDELPEALLTQNPEATGGAFARVQMLMDTPEGKGAFIRLRDGAIDEWSFGYDALDHDFSRAMKDGEEVNVRNLRTLKLYEISPVLFGMNEATTTVSAKAEADDDDKGVSDDSVVSPRDKTKELTDRGPVRRFGDVLQGSMHRLFTLMTDDLYISGYLTREQRIELSSLIGDALDVLSTGIPEDIATIELPGYDEVSMGLMASLAAYQEKHGFAPVTEQAASDNQNDKQAIDWPKFWEEVDQKRKAFYDDMDKAIELTIVEQFIAPVKQVALDDQGRGQAGPDEPPTSNVLDEIELLKVQTETLEVSYEKQGVAGEK